MENQSIGSRLKAARGNRTQQKVCDDLEITCVQTLSAYENDKNSPPIDLLKSFAQYYDVSTDWILFGKEHTPQKPKDGAGFLAQFVEAADKFNFGFSADNNPAIVMDNYNASLTEFIHTWAKFRELLESGAVTQEMYTDMIAYSITKVSFYKTVKSENEKANCPFGWTETTGTNTPNPAGIGRWK